MKLTLLLAFALIFQAAAIPAFAQTKQNDAPRSIDEELGITLPEAEPNMSGDPLRDQAMRYYNGCIQTPHPFFKAETQKLHCGCISNEMLQSMTEEDILALYDPAPTAQKSRDIFYTKVHAKCTKYPIYDFMMNTCMENKALKEKIPKHRQVCECSADTMARLVDSEAEEIMQAQLEITPQTTDPLTDYIQTSEFERVSSGYMRRCIQIHVFGYR